MRKKALLVDDSDTVRTAVKQLLGKEFETKEVDNGTEAISTLETIQDFDLLVLDFNMPGLNGLEVLEKISSKDNIKKVTTIMLITETDREKHKQISAFSFVKCWIIKPINSEKLSSALQKVFGK